MRQITLSVLCEGPTELGFVARVLRPHLAIHRVNPRPRSLDGAKGFETLRNAIKAEVGRSRAHEYVTTMLDLYALPRYPGDSRGRRTTGIQRAQEIEAAMAEGLSNPRFIPYIQVHEFEALVFVDLDQLEPVFVNGEARGATAALRRSVAHLAPEDIDDGPNTAPSKRIIAAIPAYERQKTVIGPRIAARIGLPRLREACPHFNAWITRLERLADDPSS